jgi:hypothetical protein
VRIIFGGWPRKKMPGALKNFLSAIFRLAKPDRAGISKSLSLHILSVSAAL